MNVAAAPSRTVAVVAGEVSAPATIATPSAAARRRWRALSTRTADPSGKRAASPWGARVHEQLAEQAAAAFLRAQRLGDLIRSDRAGGDEALAEAPMARHRRARAVEQGEGGVEVGGGCGGETDRPVDEPADVGERVG